MSDRTPPAASPHQWDSIRSFPVTRDRVHESLYRSWHILHEVKAMLNRGDSPQTIRTFITWAEHQHDATTTNDISSSARPTVSDGATRA